MLFPALLLALATPPAADVSAVLEAELQRTLGHLAGTPALPYFLAYRVDDSDGLWLSARQGALASQRQHRWRSLVVTVRVGAAALDNTHTLRQEFDATLLEEKFSLLNQDGPARGLQAQVWATTQRALRDAQDRLQRVVHTQAVHVPEQDRSGDFVAEPAHRWEGPEAGRLPDPGPWITRLSALSTVLAADPRVEESEAALDWGVVTSTLVNSEGSHIREAHTVGHLALWATSTAPDGALVMRSEHRYATDPAKLPDDAALRALAVTVREDLAQLREAPLGGPYAGPILLSGAAASVWMHEVIGHNAEGDMVKDENKGQTLRDAIGSPLLPATFRIYDDPTLAQYAGQPLVGHYAFDEEGVPAQRVDVIVDGVLRAFLFGRSTVAGAARSNGHGRAPVAGSPGPRTGNLILESQSPQPVAALRAELRRLAGEQGLEAGIFIETVHGGEAQVGREEAITFTLETEQVWRVYVDGRPDTRVRGVNLVGTPLVTLRQVVAAGDDAEVVNGLCGKGNGEVPVSTIAPSLLLRSAELQRAETGLQRPPLLPKPARGGRS